MKLNLNSSIYCIIKNIDKSFIIKKLENFFTQYKLQRFKKGEIIIRSDDPPLGIFYLKEGAVREYVFSNRDLELTLNTYKPYAFFPVAYAINDTLSDHIYEATTQVILWRAPKEDFLKFIKSEPAIMFDLLSRIYLGLEGFFKRMEYSMSKDAKPRLIVELLIHAKRFGPNMILTQKDLAAQSGIARETVNRILKTLKTKGLINFTNRKLVINHLDKLEKELHHLDVFL